MMMTSYKNNNDNSAKSTLVKLRAISDYTYTRTGPLRGKCKIWLTQQGVGLILCYIACLLLVTYLSTYVRNLNQNPTTLWAQDICRLPSDRTSDLIKDFRRFPCFPGLLAEPPLSSRGSCVRMLDRGRFRLFITLKESCKYLQMGERTPICSYTNVNNDTSDYFSKEGLDEKTEVESMIKVLRANKEMIFIDIGTRVGVYCIVASKVSNKTLCLDANYEHLQQITRSLFNGNIVNDALMIWNKLSNKHETTDFRIPAIRDPIQLSDLIGQSKTSRGEVDAIIKVNTITLNDLRGAFRDKPAFIKIDIGTDTEAALEGSEHFFKHVDVRVVQVALTDRNNRIGVVNFFRSFEFLPFFDAFGAKPMLRFKTMVKWPPYVYFLKAQRIKV